MFSPAPVAALSRPWVCGLWDGGIESRGRYCCLYCECCMLSGRGLCDGPIPYPEVYVVALSVIRCNNNPLHLPWVSKERLGKERKTSLEFNWNVCALQLNPTTYGQNALGRPGNFFTISYLIFSYFEMREVALKQRVTLCPEYCPDVRS
jgi:hypothetical protein